MEFIQSSEVKCPKSGFVLGFSSLIACYLVRLDEQFFFGGELSKYFSGRDGSVTPARKIGPYGRTPIRKSSSIRLILCIRSNQAGYLYYIQI